MRPDMHCTPSICWAPLQAPCRIDTVIARGLHDLFTEVRQTSVATIWGYPINVANQAQAVSEIIGAAQRGEGFTVFTLNLDHLDKLKRDRSFQAAYAATRFITADGAPVALLASRQGRRVERTTGADMVVPLVEAAAEQNVAVFLFGSSNGVLARAGMYLSERTNYKLNIVGTVSPEQGFDPESAAADAEIDRIAASGARLYFVALGAPKQEVLAARAVARGVKVGFVCIGAGLDFLVGAQTRAPEFMQRNGLEWFWRLSTAPRRLASRYARCFVVLAELLLTEPLKVRSAK
jgi:exopolysaccharide biosynthesis WecB/TagA/CpsF family protein